MTASEALDAEDAKLLTLARAARARASAVEGAAVRDDMGRTYAAAEVALPSLRLSAMQVAVAMAVSSGVTALEAALLVTPADAPGDEDVAAVRDVGGSQTLVIVAAPDGSVRARLTAG